MPKHFKKYLFLFAILFLFLTVSQTVFALEFAYPKIPGFSEGFAKDSTPSLPELIKYFFGLAVVLAGIMGVISIVISGIILLIKSGSPGAMGDARERIFSSILGIILLLFSVTLLSTINPALTDLKESKLSSGPIGALRNNSQGGGNTTKDGGPVSYLEAPRSGTIDNEFNWFSNNCDTGPNLILHLYGPKGETAVDLPCGAGRSMVGFASYKWEEKVPGVYLFKGAGCFAGGSNVTSTFFNAEWDKIDDGFERNVKSALIVLADSFNEPNYAFVLNDGPDGKKTCSSPYTISSPGAQMINSNEYCVPLYDIASSGCGGGGGGDDDDDGGGNNKTYCDTLNTSIAKCVPNGATGIECTNDASCRGTTPAPRCVKNAVMCTSLPCPPATYSCEPGGDGALCSTPDDCTPPRCVRNSVMCTSLPCPPATYSCEPGGTGALCDTPDDCTAPATRCVSNSVMCTTPPCAPPTYSCEPGGDGAPCSTPDDCTARCVKNPCMSTPGGTCTPTYSCVAGGTGKLCATDGECSSGPKCNTTNNTCSLSGDGEACSVLGASCGGGGGGGNNPSYCMMIGVQGSASFGGFKCTEVPSGQNIPTGSTSCKLQSDCGKFGPVCSFGKCVMQMMQFGEPECDPNTCGMGSGYGMICVNKTCVPGTETNPLNTFCDTTTCVYSDFGGANGNSCNYGSDCNSGRCTYGVCNAGGTNGSSCQVGSDCASNNCVNGICFGGGGGSYPNGANCTQGSQCTSGACLNGVCSNPGSSSCNDQNKCAGLPGGTTCNDDSQCNQGASGHCVYGGAGGVCVPGIGGYGDKACTGQGDCVTHATCTPTACVLVPGAGADQCAPTGDFATQCSPVLCPGGTLRGGQCCFKAPAGGKDNCVPVGQPNPFPDPNPLGLYLGITPYLIANQIQQAPKLSLASFWGGLDKMKLAVGPVDVGDDCVVDGYCSIGAGETADNCPMDCRAGSDADSSNCSPAPAASIYIIPRVDESADLNKIAGANYAGDGITIYEYGGSTAKDGHRKDGFDLAGPRKVNLKRDRIGMQFEWPGGPDKILKDGPTFFSPGYEYDFNKNAPGKDTCVSTTDPGTPGNTQRCVKGLVCRGGSLVQEGMFCTYNDQCAPGQCLPALQGTCEFNPETTCTNDSDCPLHGGGEEGSSSANNKNYPCTQSIKSKGNFIIGLYSGTGTNNTDQFCKFFTDGVPNLIKESNDDEKGILSNGKEILNLYVWPVVR